MTMTKLHQNLQQSRENEGKEKIKTKITEKQTGHNFAILAILK